MKTGVAIGTARKEWKKAVQDVSWVISSRGALDGSPAIHVSIPVTTRTNPNLCREIKRDAWPRVLGISGVFLQLEVSESASDRDGPSGIRGFELWGKKVLILEDRDFQEQSGKSRRGWLVVSSGRHHTIEALIWGKPGLKEQTEAVYDAANPPVSRTLEMEVHCLNPLVSTTNSNGAIL